MGSNDASVAAVKLITVHGTGDNAPTVQPVKWWQDGSEFIADVRSRLAARGEELDVDPFMWSGAYSEEQRRDAGRKLAKKIKKSANGGKVILVGHSHGGSVIDIALRMGDYSRRERDNIVKWVTVGAPFVKLDPGPPVLRNFVRLDPLRQAFVIVLLALSLLFVLPVSDPLFRNDVYEQIDLRISENPTTDQTKPQGQIDEGKSNAPEAINPSDGNPVPEESGEALADLRSASENGAANVLRDEMLWQARLVSAMAMVVLSLLVAWPGHGEIGRIYSRGSQRRFASDFAGKWVGIWHPNDEAIRALVAGSQTRLKIIPRRLIDGFIVLVVIGVFFASVNLALGDMIIGLIERFIEEEFNLLFGVSMNGIAEWRGDDSWRELTPQIAPMFDAIAIVVVVSFLLILGLYQLVRMSDLGRRFSLPDDTILNFLRNLVVSNDARGERFVAIEHFPRGTNKIAPMEAPIAESMVSYTDSHSQDALKKLREGLTIFSQASRESSVVDLQNVIRDRLTWKELIHTTYFKAPEAREHIAELVASQ